MQISSIKDIGKLVKETRKKQKLTQVQLAQLSNVGTRFLSDLENGKPTCEVEKTLKIKNAVPTGIPFFVKRIKIMWGRTW